MNGRIMLRACGTLCVGLIAFAAAQTAWWTAAARSVRVLSS